VQRPVDPTRRRCRGRQCEQITHDTVEGGFCVAFARGGSPAQAIGSAIGLRERKQAAHFGLGEIRPISHEFTGCGQHFYAPLPRALVRSSWERNYDV